MKPIQIPVTLSPHFGGGKPKGYYLIAQRLFPDGAPILSKHQFVGFDGSLVVTVQHPGEWDTVLKMAIYVSKLEDEPTTWLSKAHLYPMPMGFRMYIPGTVLKPKSAEVQKIETIGVFCKWGLVYYVYVPKISGEILLGRKELE